MENSLILQKIINDYEKENIHFDRKKFDDIQVLAVVFIAMDAVKNNKI